MKFNFLQQQTSRRKMLRDCATLGASAFLAHLFPASLLRASAARNAQQTPSAADLPSSMRAKFNAVPMETQKLADSVTMFDGPGGAVVVLNGLDGKFIVDDFVAAAWPKLKQALDGLGNAPLKYVINTHWHFDHTDNNARLHAAGAMVLAHENTKRRMSEPHDLPVLHRRTDGTLAGLHFDPSPAEALPQQTFAYSYKYHGPLAGAEPCGQFLSDDHDGRLENQTELDASGGKRSNHQPRIGTVVCQASQQPCGRSCRRESQSTSPGRKKLQL